MLESLMALVHPWLTFTGMDARTHFQSFRVRKYLAAMACKDEICRVQNQVPGARYPPTPFFYFALPSLSMSHSPPVIYTF